MPASLLRHRPQVLIVAPPFGSAESRATYLGRSYALAALALAEGLLPVLPLALPIAFLEARAPDLATTVNGQLGDLYEAHAQALAREVTATAWEALLSDDGRSAPARRAFVAWHRSSKAPPWVSVNWEGWSSRFQHAGLGRLWRTYQFIGREEGEGAKTLHHVALALVEKYNGDGLSDDTDRLLELTRGMP